MHISNLDKNQSLHLPITKQPKTTAIDSYGPASLRHGNMWLKQKETKENNVTYFFGNSASISSKVSGISLPSKCGHQKLNLATYQPSANAAATGSSSLLKISRISAWFWMLAGDWESSCWATSCLSSLKKA